MDEATAEPSDIERRAAELVRAARDAVASGDDGRRHAVHAQLSRLRNSIDEAFAVLDAQTDRRVSTVFEQLRAEPPPKKPRAPRKPVVEKAVEAEIVVADDEPTAPEPDPDPEPDAPSASPDDGVRARRDAVLEPLLPDLVRASKRLLQDEQNLLQDAARRARTRVDPDRLLPDAVRHREVWATTISAAADVAYGSGRTSGGRKRKSGSAPDRVVNELAAALVAPLRERLTTTIESVIAEGPYPSTPDLTRALVSAIGARYREWKARDLEVALLDALSAAYARGAYDAAPSGVPLRWVPDRPGQCPDCDDNSLEETVKSKLFPTGQAYPPAHPGCRCIVVPADDVPDRGPPTADR